MDDGGSRLAAAGGFTRGALALPGATDFVYGRMPPERVARYTIRDLLISLFFHKRALMIAFAVPLAIGIFAAAMSKLVYIADARLLVLLGSQYVLQPDSPQGGATIAFDRNQIIQSEIEILQAQSLRIAVLRKLGVDHIYPPAPPSTFSLHALLSAIPGIGHDKPDDPREGGTLGDKEVLAAERLRGDLSISSIPQSNVILLTYRNADRDLAAEVLNAVIAAYIDRRGDIYRRGSADGGADQRDQYAARLRDAEAELARFAEDTHISSFDEQVTLLLHDQAGLTQNLHDTEQRLSSVSAQVETLRRQLGKVPSTVELFAESQRSQVAGSLTDTLLKLEGERRDMMTRFRPEYPPLMDVERQIAAVHAQIARAGGQNAPEPSISRRGQNPAFSELSVQLTKLEVERDGLAAQQATMVGAQHQVQSRLDQLNQIGARYRELKRTRDVVEETFRNFVRTNEEARLADQQNRGQAANIRIIQPAEPPPFGTRPRKMLLIAGAAVGLLAAGVMFWLMSAMRQTMIGVSDAERELQLPVLVAVPERRGLVYTAIGQRSGLFRDVGGNDGTASA